MRRMLGTPLTAIMPLALLMLASCGEQVPRVTPAMVEDARQDDHRMTQERLEHGRALYLQRCGTCHAVFSPRSHPRSAWPHWVGTMGPRAHLTIAQDDAVLAYLQAAQRY